VRILSATVTEVSAKGQHFIVGQGFIVPIQRIGKINRSTFIPAYFFVTQYPEHPFRQADLIEPFYGNLR